LVIAKLYVRGEKVIIVSRVVLVESYIVFVFRGHTFNDIVVTGQGDG
jgi:hypothetical protein